MLVKVATGDKYAFIYQSGHAWTKIIGWCIYTYMYKG